MNSTALWKERFRHFLKEVRTYSKYVFNDHLKFILFLSSVQERIITSNGYKR